MTSIYISELRDELGDHTPVDKSSTIVTGGVAQNVATTNNGRRGFTIQNVSSGDLWISVVGVAATAAPPSIWLPSGSYYELPAITIPSSTISIFGSTTGQAFSAMEW